MEEVVELTVASVGGENERRESPVRAGPPRRPPGRCCSLFYFAERPDYLLMLFGSIGSCIHGATLPVFFVLFGKLIDSLGSLASSPQRLSNEVSKVKCPEN